MKVGHWLMAAMLAVSACGTVSFAAEKAADKPADKQYKEGGCCDKAKKAGEACKHKCCVAAEKDGKVCEKCNKAA